MIVVVGAPCLACAKAMCEAGISSVAAVTDEHADETGIVFLRRQTGIELRLLSVDEVFELGKSIKKLRKAASGRMI